MIERIVTVQFDIYDGDVDSAATGRMRVGLLETLHINWVEGQWEVTNPKDDPERHWVGHADNNNMAILDYLRARMGIPEPGEEI